MADNRVQIEGLSATALAAQWPHLDRTDVGARIVVEKIRPCPIAKKK